MHLNKGPRAMLLSTNTVDTDRQVLKSRLRCLKSHMMLSANKLHRLRVPLKAIQANKLRPSHNNSLELSHPHQTSSPHITPPTLNNAMRTTAITSNSMGCSKVRRASKMAPPSNDHSVDTMVLKLKELLNSHRPQPNKLRLVMQLPVVKEAAITLPTQPPRLSSKELAKAPNLNSPATHNNLKLATTPMAIPTTRAHITLHI